MFMLGTVWVSYQITVNGDAGQMVNIRREDTYIIRSLLQETEINIMHRQAAPVQIQLYIFQTEHTFRLRSFKTAAKQITSATLKLLWQEKCG